jgi:hypothetical protein
MSGRHPFALTPADWTFQPAAWTLATADGTAVAPDADNPPLAQMVPAGQLTMWNAASSGTQVTDLTSDSAGLDPISGGIIISSDGTDGYVVGQVEQFYGPPDDTTELWADGNAGAGPRVKLTATDTGSRVAANTLAITNLQDSQANDEAVLALVPVMCVADSGGTYPARPDVAGGRVVIWIGDSTPAVGGTGGALEGDVFIDRTP